MSEVSEKEASMPGETRLKNNVSVKENTGTLTRVARNITNLAAPPILAIPTYLILGLYDTESHIPSERYWLGQFLAITFGVTIPIVLVLLLRIGNKVNSIHIPIRSQRTIPFILTITSYLVGVVLLLVFYGNGYVTALAICYTANLLIVLLINFFWKISVHMTGVGSPLAILTITSGGVIAPFFLLFPMVGWARVYLKAHTLPQVIGGSVFGYFFSLFQLIYIFKPIGWF
ncbi:MAG: hypothetical protein HXX08_20805 [Chloroflexi bacterium]|uniref:PAP2 family protein n=1 Tax=Candidatus Chlorohelix allophototropha TaxID=3003348 RepID=A0A8T7M8H7_9CHLR|nr:hypothetical protein [Chloroflexota bacterium]WJW68237.1 hypothetical protein OZ401_003844 [Chloroflexota bacterium L227-S17]